ncbi:hypothetical protein CKY39_16250 [Variovorax boronicumulans]|uniref:DUF2163 domain-containing protein n=1 Tax=Variovorax boronicumulans TaxID=436515 RepID=A0A250DJN2_9BURK|nr:hypothetical protein [Variovorax boronicumulans]ATA54587.1 hypothetical protein CKY39_16250 [Variovorax boronicumulans]
MRTLTPSAVAALSARELNIVRLVRMEFPGFDVALNSSNQDIVYEGVTYLGAAGLGAISQIDDSPGEIKGMQLEMSGVSIDYLALALADATIVQGTQLTMRLAILDENWQVVDAPVDWAGALDTMPIQEDGETCTIAATAESSAVDLLRGTPMTYSNVDQQALYPGDRAFEYLNSQIGKPIVWAGKQWLIALNGK